MFHIALYEPQIAPNTGNIIRLMANNGSHLHLIEPLGFDLEAKKLRRAGLDYRDMTSVTRYPDYTTFLAQMGDRRIFACTTKGRAVGDGQFCPGPPPENSHAPRLPQHEFVQCGGYCQL